MKGTIKLLKNGYGFIGTDGGKDVFFHAKDLNGVTFDSLKPGLAVTFEMGESPKGPKAEQVTLA